MECLDRGGRGGMSEGVPGWETGTCMKLPFDCMRESYSDLHLEIDYSVTYCRQTDMDLEID